MLMVVELALGCRVEIGPPALDAADDLREAALREAMLLGQLGDRAAARAVVEEDGLVAARGSAFFSGLAAVVGWRRGADVAGHGGSPEFKVRSSKFQVPSSKFQVGARR